MAAVGHWHAIKRDLLALQRSADEIDTGTLPFTDLVSIVVASPTTSSVFMVLDSWSKTDQLLANWQEQTAGLIDLQHRYNRPGVPTAGTAGNPTMANQATQIQAQGGVRRERVAMDSMTIEEWIDHKADMYGYSDEKRAEQKAALLGAGLLKVS